MGRPVMAKWQWYILGALSLFIGYHLIRSYRDDRRLNHDSIVVNVVFRKLGHKRMLPPAKQREAEVFVRAKAADIARKWNEYFVLHQHVAPERITKRIK